MNPHPKPDKHIPHKGGGALNAAGLGRLIDRAYQSALVYAL